jgi:hypothetical protein
MPFATRNEIQYLAAMDGKGNGDALIREMSRRLEALRRYDQCFSAADWHPRRGLSTRRSRKRGQSE